jgi:hypothetical protein
LPIGVTHGLQHWRKALPQVLIRLSEHQYHVGVCKIDSMFSRFSPMIRC